MGKPKGSGGGDYIGKLKGSGRGRQQNCNASADVMVRWQNSKAMAEVDSILKGNGRGR